METSARGPGMRLYVFEKPDEDRRYWAYTEDEKWPETHGAEWQKVGETKLERRMDHYRDFMDHGFHILTFNRDNRREEEIELAKLEKIMKGAT